MRRGTWAVVAFLLLAPALDAQARDAGRAGVVRPDIEEPDTAAGRQAPRAPISPGRAFFSSLVVPGSGQAALDRPYAGGVFLLVEAISLSMLHRAGEDLRLARHFARDSVPLTYQTDPVTGVVAVDGDGAPIVATWQAPRYGTGIVRSRRLQVEDWLAALFFNHLFAGADAYVAAQLWDLPGMIGLKQTPFGPAIAATLRFGRPARR